MSDALKGIFYQNLAATLPHVITITFYNQSIKLVHKATAIHQFNSVFLSLYNNFR